MKKKSAIVKLIVTGIVLVLGLVLCFCSFKIGNKNIPSWASNIKLGLDLKGGIYAEYVALDDDTGNLDERMNGTVTSIQSLLVNKGYPEATVVRQGSAGIRVEVPDVENPSAILEILGEPAKLAFRVDDGDATGDVFMTGDNVVKAEPGYYNGQYVVSLKLDSVGATKFAEVTGKCATDKTKISIYVSYGEEEKCISSATCDEQITGGQATISGNFTLESAQELADQIMSGTFGVTLKLQKCDPISPTLGEGALKYGLIAGIIGLALVMIFMICRYRLFGAVASIALALYTVMMLFFLDVIPLVQLTLPGIAGILLSIGMAIDGNVIIYERIKDEYAAGKSILSAVHYGYRKSVSAILDGNITTIIAAVILYICGSGSVQGFSVTLLIGIVLAVFSSLVVTKGLMDCFVTFNHSNEKFYNLKRSEKYASVAADENDAAVQMDIDSEQKSINAKKAAVAVGEED